MKDITCDCGHKIPKDYNRVVKIVTANGAIYTWKCEACGQDWFEKVKEPKEIPHADS